MSQLNVDTIKKADGTGNLSVPAETGTVVTTASPSLGRRNLIINGAMQVAQRGTTATGSGATSGYRTVDRFRTLTSNTDELVYTQDQASDAPAGFSKSFKVTVSTAETSLAADENSTVRQAIESQDLQHLNYGTSDAVECSLSFWVKSSLTGTYAFAIYQEGGNKLFVSNYTVSSADTWEQKTISIPANTTGAFNNDNNVGMSLVWWLGAGSNFTSSDSSLDTWATYSASAYAYGHDVNFITTSGATWQITGVQLEVGDTATPFEHRSYGEELAACQRYFQYIPSAERVPTWASANSTYAFSTNLLVKQMRAQPSLSLDSALRFDAYYVSTFDQSSADITLNSGQSMWVVARFGNFTGLTRSDAGVVYNGNISIDAEL